LIEIKDGVRFSTWRLNCRTSAAAPSFYVLLYDGHWSTPRMLAALAGLVHHRQRAKSDEHNRDKDND
jgi:hypothetical protein